jgi:hypothetical protein
MKQEECGNGVVEIDTALLRQTAGCGLFSKAMASTHLQGFDMCLIRVHLAEEEGRAETSFAEMTACCIFRKKSYTSPRIIPKL